MSQNLQRISVSVDKDEYEELKKHTRAGISIGFLISLFLGIIYALYQNKKEGIIFDEINLRNIIPCDYIYKLESKSIDKSVFEAILSITL